MGDMLNVASKANISSSSNKKQSYEEGVLTEVEENPWCLVDLGRNFPCSGIKIYNLKIIDNLKVEISSDLKEWYELSISSQNDSGLYFQILSQIQTRYIRVSCVGYVCLEFSKLEAYVTDLIVSARDDALGSRMYALVNGMIIAKKIGFNFGYVWKDIYFDWQSSDDNAAGMEVDPENLVFNEDFIQNYSYKNYLSVGKPLALKDKNINSLKQKPYDNPWGYYAPLGYDFDDYSDENYRKGFKECFFEIHFHKNIQVMFDEVEKLALKLGQFVSFHLRGVDIIYGSASKIYHKACYYKVFPYEIALEGIKQELKSNKKVLLFGDDLKLLAEIKKYFQDDSIIIVDELIDRKKNTATQNAFFEIYLMSKSQKIYRAGSSLFSRFAHAISNAKMANIFKDYSKQERFDWILKNINTLSLEPFHRKAYSYFCLYLLSKELKLSLDQSLKYINLAIENYPDNYLFYSLYLIDCYVEKNDLEKVEELTRKSLLLDKNAFFKSLFMNYGGLVNNKEMLNIIEFSKKINLDENHPFFCYLIAKIYFFKKDYTKVVEICKELVRYEFLYKNEVIKILFESQRYIIEKQTQDLQICNTKLNELNCMSKSSLSSDKQKIAKLQSQLNFVKLNGTAIERVKNHLTYKIGFLIARNSKNFTTILTTPFKIFLVYLCHISSNEVKPNLKEYPDYQEALKLQNSKEYKYGKAFIKAHKKWYKGGYIRLFKELRKIK
ncbi:hypothetical protein A0Z86_03110 [Campylobacter lari]|nr:hypothetical protein [Campylobacter lari]